MKKLMENSENRIIFVITSMGRGGAERVISVLANYYASMKWEVHIVMLWHNIIDYELNENIQVHSLAMEGKNDYLKLPCVVFKLRKLIMKITPRAVVAFIAQNAIVSYIACRGLGTRLLVSERIDPSNMKRGKIFSTLLHKTYANASVTVLQTERAKKFFPPKVQANSLIIYNPITVKYHAEKNREKIIITAGRLEKQKNHEMLISAFARFSERFPDYKLHIYGDGSLREELETLIKEKGIEHRAFLMGVSKEIHEIMSKAEIFVLSSNNEGMSNALMEAMAIGLPCISTNCSGADELIQNGKNGLLVPVGNEDELYEAMIYMASNREVAEKMGEAARDFSQIYKTENVIEQWRHAIEGE